MENLQKLLSESTQYIYASAINWDSVNGKLQLFSRKDLSSEWHADSEVLPVVFGKNGLAWGKGLHEIPSNASNIKKEGDNKAPVGVFRISKSFGYEPNSSNPEFPHIAIHEKMLGIDDPGSTYYNQIIDSTKIEQPDWKSAEKMLREDELYEVGLAIDHNTAPALPGFGSCIFMHIWRGQGLGTEGCTAMAKKNMREVINWLREDAKPLLVQEIVI